LVKINEVTLQRVQLSKYASKNISKAQNLQSYIYMYTHTQPFYGSLDFVWDNPGKPVPEGTFCHLLDFLVQNEDNTGGRTNNPYGLPPHPD